MMNHGITHASIILLLYHLGGPTLETQMKRNQDIHLADLKMGRYTAVALLPVTYNSPFTKAG
nr:unnamed protein product [Digitaria exilis]